MDKIKLKWKVGAAPTGRFRSFDSRAWPSAYYDKTDRAACMITCTESYTPALGRDPAPKKFGGGPLELIVRIADYTPIEGGSSWKWRSLTRRFDNLDAAKEAAEKFLNDNAAFRPKELQ